LVAHPWDGAVTTFSTSAVEISRMLFPELMASGDCHSLRFSVLSHVCLTAGLSHEPLEFLSVAAHPAEAEPNATATAVLPTPLFSPNAPVC
jgi:hypothetical protein